MAEPSPIQQTARIMLSGNGNQVTKQFSLDGNPAVFTWQYKASAPLRIWLLNDQGQRETQLVNVCEVYNGFRTIGAPDGNYRCEVEASEGWTIIVEQPTPANAPRLP